MLESVKHDSVDGFEPDNVCRSNQSPIPPLVQYFSHSAGSLHIWGEGEAKPGSKRGSQRWWKSWWGKNNRSNHLFQRAVCQDFNSRNTHNACQHILRSIYRKLKNKSAPGGWNTTIKIYLYIVSGIHFVNPVSSTMPCVGCRCISKCRFGSGAAYPSFPPFRTSAPCRLSMKNIQICFNNLPPLLPAFHRTASQKCDTSQVTIC